MKSGNLNFPEPCGPLQACNRTALLLPFLEITLINKTAFSSIVLTETSSVSQTEKASDLIWSLWLCLPAAYNLDIMLSGFRR